jgi:nitrate reductase beta subunit
VAKVFNWQLGREMEYPYEAPRPEKQFTMIMDTNKCIACQSCTITCKSTWTWGRGQEYMLWNNIETKPYGFYPTGWDVNVLALLGEQTWEDETYPGQTLFEAAAEGERVLGWAPEDADWNHPNLGEDEPTGDATETPWLPDKPHSMMWMFYLQRICNHCTYPACVASCPRQAIYKRPEDGIVLVDQTRCRGYQECVRACPYKKTMFNLETRVSEKCIGCFPKIEQGLQTQCTTACIGRLRLTNFLSPPDQADPKKPADFLVHVKKVDTTQMFGPGVQEAIDAYNNAKDDPELLGLLMLFGATERIMDTFDVRDGIAYAYDENGEEIVSVPVQEPTFVRPYEFPTEIAGEPATGFRHNT